MTTKFEYPARFADDLKYLSAWYGWTDDDKKDVRAMFKDHMPTVNFFMALAAAHRAGYNDQAGNGFMTLHDWCDSKGLRSPFEDGFSLRDVKAIAEIE